MLTLKNLKIKLFADGADLSSMVELYSNPMIKGFTTNPTLMRKSGITNYETFARDVLKAISDRPVSFEVFADDLPIMAEQAKVIASWGPNVFVKVPVTNTKGQSTAPIVRELSDLGVHLNVTAVFTVAQVRDIIAALNADVPSIISVFAGRIADTGRDPVPLMRECLDVMSARPNAELLWASPRELLNVFHAEEAGCHIITATPDLLNKLSGVDKNLDVFSLETVKMFYDDANAAGFSITVNQPSEAGA